MPRELMNRIRDDLAAILQNPDVRKRLFDIGGESVGEPAAEFTAGVRNEIERWMDVAKTAGIKLL